MQVFLVGGAVRDELLGMQPYDLDYVVTGSSELELTALGYKKVGISFPVFLHPETFAQYALARTEVKTGSGYSGFSVSAGADTPLEVDLERRDLTINSMAKDPITGKIIDPFGGQKDLQNKLLRHTSPAFAEDPLRVIRVARFYSRFFERGFTVDPATIDLCKQVVSTGALDELRVERFLIELGKAIEEPNFKVFLDFIDEIGALKKCNFFSSIFPYYLEKEKICAMVSSINKHNEYSMPTDKVRMLTLLLCPLRSPFLHPRASTEMHDAIHQLRTIKRIKAYNLFQILSSARTFEHNNFYLEDLVMLIKILEDVGIRTAVSSVALECINSLTKKIPKEIVEGSNGSEIKQKVEAFRLEKIKKCLV